MINSFSAKTLEYVRKKYKNRFPLHGQGIYRCNRSADTCEAYRKAIEYGCRMFTSNDIYKAEKILSELGAR